LTPVDFVNRETALRQRDLSSGKIRAITQVVVTLLLTLAFRPELFGQAVGGVSQVYTDFKGYWSSGTGTGVSSLKPNKSHHLLAFTWKNKTYSTGINDAVLESKAVTFTPAIYQAFPVRNIASSSTTYIGLGQIQDGVHGGISSSPPFPVPPNLSNFLTDGLQGLDIATGVANIQAGELIFDFTGIIDKDQIQDGIPDILVSQVADPSSTTDEIYLTDARGQVVGRSLSITHNNIASVGKWTADFYKLNGKETAFTNEDRDLRLWVAELSAFGIDGSNYFLVKSMRYKLKGSSDPAFAAFKVGVFDIISANNDQAESERGEAVEIDVLDNDQPSAYLDLGSVRIKTAPKGGSVTLNPLTGAITYTPYSDFYDIDNFVYEVCSNSSEADLCDEAQVEVSVRSYIPIRLLNFSAILLESQHVRLAWSTTGELNHSYFEVQRSSNGRDWELIKNVPGEASSASSNSYAVVDQNPTGGYNYYRLKQVDRNGDFRLFHVISVQTKEENAHEIALFPNPGVDRITVKGPASELSQLSIVNAMGQQMQGIKVSQISESHFRVNLEHIPSGFYILRTATEAKVFRKQ